MTVTEQSLKPEALRADRVYIEIICKLIKEDYIYFSLNLRGDLPVSFSYGK